MATADGSFQIIDSAEPILAAISRLDQAIKEAVAKDEIPKQSVLLKARGNLVGQLSSFKRHEIQVFRKYLLQQCEQLQSEAFLRDEWWWWCQLAGCSDEAKVKMLQIQIIGERDIGALYLTFDEMTEAINKIHGLKIPEGSEIRDCINLNPELLDCLGQIIRIIKTMPDDPEALNHE